MMRVAFLVVCPFIVIVCCTAAKYTDANKTTRENMLTSASFTTKSGEVLYEFSKSELDTLDGMYCSANRVNVNPVTSPAWNNYLKLTFKSGKCAFYLIYDQFIRQKNGDTVDCYMFTANIFWLYNKAKQKLGEASKEYQKFPKGL